MAILSTAAALVSAMGSAFGAAKKSDAARRQTKRIRDMERRSDEWYRRERYTDAFDRAGYRGMLQKASERAKELVKAAEARAAVLGGTDAAVAAQKDAAYRAIADTAGRIHAQDEERRQSLERQHLADKNAIDEMKSQRDAERVDALNTAVQGLSETMGAVASMQGGAGTKQRVAAPSEKQPAMSQPAMDKNRMDVQDEAYRNIRKNIFAPSNNNYNGRNRR